MRTSAEYRAEAKGYVLQAEGISDPGRRARLLEMLNPVSDLPTKQNGYQSTSRN
jgi:hypothetical protein